MTWDNQQAGQLVKLLEKVRDDRRFWPDEASLRAAHSILPVPATEVALVKRGWWGRNQLLLQYRTFADWPEPYNRAGWYIPGGYVPWMGSIRESCQGHLRKDLAGEYKRLKLADADSAVEISNPILIGAKKWMPNEHPFGAPVSLVYVCELQKGNIRETDWLQWVTKTVPTDVPHHQVFQDLVFAWLRTPARFKEIQYNLATLLE
jgi:hypothetical protein